VRAGLPDAQVNDCSTGVACRDLGVSLPVDKAGAVFANALPYLLFALGEQKVSSSTAGVLGVAVRPQKVVFRRLTWPECRLQHAGRLAAARRQETTAPPTSHGHLRNVE
jgi:hypothetical protein